MRRGGKSALHRASGDQTDLDQAACPPFDFAACAAPKDTNLREQKRLRHFELGAGRYCPRMSESIPDEIGPGLLRDLARSFAIESRTSSQLCQEVRSEFENGMRDHCDFSSGRARHDGVWAESAVRSGHERDRTNICKP